jgi:hypothetical protein
MSIPEIVNDLFDGEFCPPAAKVMIDFLMRHGFITPENEPDFMRLLWACKQEHPVAIPSALV